MDKLNKKELLASYKDRKMVGGICAIKNAVTGKLLVISTNDLQGCKNRFDFSQSTGSCINMKLQNDWKKYGKCAFIFEILEKYEKKETQTPEEFKNDIKVLEEMWLEKLDAAELY
jgi:hypothetical protein